MGSPSIFSGRRTKLLTADGILNSNNSINDNDGVENYIKNGHAEVNTTGWATYADAAGSSPVDGTGGSPTVTFTRSTTSPLKGSGSFLFTKDAANRQGEGASYDFTISDVDKARIMQIKVPYQVSSGTFTAGSSTTDSDITVWIYDVTNSRLIQPSTFKLFSNSSTTPDSLVANFQTSADSTSYRFIMHCATTSASAYVVKFDGIQVSPTTYSLGTNITDWLSYTPTFTGFGTATNVAFFYRRVGGNCEIRGKATSGTATGVEARITLPNSIVPDSTKIAATIDLVGYGIAAFSNSTNFGTFSVLAEPSNSYLTFGQESSTANGWTKGTGSAVVGNSTAFGISASIPITGWTASTQTSDINDQRIVAAGCKVSAGVSVSTTQAANFATTEYDTHAALSVVSSGTRFTAPIAGVYRVGASIATVASSGQGGLYKNGTLFRAFTEQGNANYGCALATELSLVAGDYLDIRFSTSTTTTATVEENFFTVSRVAAPQQISATETIAVSAYAVIPATVSGVVAWGSSGVAVNTHNAYNASTGIFTAPASGLYQIAFQITTTSLVADFYVAVNASNLFRSYGTTGGSNNNFPLTAVVRLKAGDTLAVAVSGTASYLATANYHFMSIQRIGL